MTLCTVHILYGTETSEESALDAEDVEVLVSPSVPTDLFLYISLWTLLASPKRLVVESFVTWSSLPTAQPDDWRGTEGRMPRVVAQGCTNTGRRGDYILYLVS
jgi:hypothetical protein